MDGSRTAQFEHTLLVTEDGVEVLTARMEGSPGGAIEMLEEAKVSEEKTIEGNGTSSST